MKQKSLQRGQTLVIFALTFTILVGFAGLAIDGSHDYLIHRNSQNAADAAALAATNLMSQQPTAFTGPPSTSLASYVQAAHDLAATNGFPTSLGVGCDNSAGGRFTTNWVDTGTCNGNTFNHRVSFNSPPTTLVGACLTQPLNCVEVVITEHITNYITGAIGAPTTTSVTSASAYAKQAQAGSGFTNTGFQAVYLYERSGVACVVTQCFDSTKAMPASPRPLMTCAAGACPTFFSNPGSTPLIVGIDGKTNLNPSSHQVALYSMGDMVIKGATTVCDPFGPAACAANSAVGQSGYAVATGANIFCSPQTGTAVPPVCGTAPQTGLAGLAGNQANPPQTINYSPTIVVPIVDCGALVLNGEPITASSFTVAPDPTCIPGAADQFTILPGKYKYIVINHGAYNFEAGIFDITGTANVTTRTSGTATDGIDHGRENAADFDLCTTLTSNGCLSLTAGVWIGRGRLGFTAATTGTGGTCASGVPVAGSQGGGGDQTIVSGSGVTFRFESGSRGFVSTNEVTAVSLAGPGSGSQLNAGGAPVLFDMENNGVIHLDSSGATTDAGGNKVSSSFTGLTFQAMTAGAGGVELNPGLSGANNLPALSGQVLAYSMATFGGSGRAVDFTGGYGSAGGGILVPKSKLEAVIIPSGGSGVSYGLRAPVQPTHGALTYPTTDQQFYLKYTDEWALDAYDTYITVNGGPPIFFSQGIWKPPAGSGTSLPPNGAPQTNPDDAHPARVTAAGTEDTGSNYPTKANYAPRSFDWILKGTDSTLGQYYFQTNGDFTWGHESDILGATRTIDTAELDFTFPVPAGQTVHILMYMTDGDHCGDYVTLDQTFTNMAGSGTGAPIPGGVQLIQ